MKSKITLNVAEAVKKVLNANIDEGRIDDLKDNEAIRKNTDWYHDKLDKREKKREESNVKTHLGKYGRSNLKSTNEEIESLEELDASTLRDYRKKSIEQAQNLGLSRNEYDHKKGLKRMDSVRLANRKLDKKYIEKGNENLMDKTNEEIEELDEISKSTLGSYIKKADSDRVQTAAKFKDYHSKKQRHAEKGEIELANGMDGVLNRFGNKLSNRRMGIEKAVNRLTKEEIEELDEISKSTLGSYIKKATSSNDKRSISNLSSLAAHKLSLTAGKDDGEKEDKKSFMRSKGIHTAVNRLTKEEISFSDRLEIFNQYGLKGLFESLQQYNQIIEEPDSEEYEKELEITKKKSTGEIRNDENIPKGKVDAVKNEEYELDESEMADPKKQKRKKIQVSVNRPIEYKITDAATGKTLEKSGGWKEKEIKNEEYELDESEMSDAEMQKREKIVKGMKKNLSSFRKQYGDRAKDVMYATATKMAQED